MVANLLALLARPKDGRPTGTKKPTPTYKHAPERKSRRGVCDGHHSVTSGISLGGSAHTVGV